MAKGYPQKAEENLLPECPACGSQSFREMPGGLRCDSCGAVHTDPFALLP